ncbi:MAG: hypothetical protein ACJ8AT_12680 [Hyalangium sp.]|uniref:hypothetical protein n=1 Tax=Hyalangium sp. TaxID=2028555 RepID=UPI00389A5330
MPVVLKCPQCNAPLAPSRFARSVVCSFCGATVQIDPTAVSTARFREAYQEWNQPARYGYTRWCTLGDAHWAPRKLIARGELSDVYSAERARFPTERVLLKVLRSEDDARLFEHEWEALEKLQQSTAPGAETLSARTPQPVARGVIREGPHTGSRAMVLRWASGFAHTLEDVRRVYPSGIAPPASIWLWRRLLETLTFVHQSGLVHGAVLPQHVLIQRNEHGAWLVGYSCAGAPEERLRALCTRFQEFYPAELLRSERLSPAADLRMSARCIAWVLGGDAARGEVPAAVPRPLAALIRRVASEGPEHSLEAAWTLRERVGEVGRAAFGPPAFHPLVMP